MLAASHAVQALATDACVPTPLMSPSPAIIDPSRRKLRLVACALICKLEIGLPEMRFGSVQAQKMVSQKLLSGSIALPKR
jgi:hypothetical protein